MHQRRRTRATRLDFPDTRGLVRASGCELPSIRAENRIGDQAAVPCRLAHLLACGHVPDLRALMPFRRKDVASASIKSGEARPDERRYSNFAPALRRPVNHETAATCLRNQDAISIRRK